jgi:site-specific recombinase XerC
LPLRGIPAVLDSIDVTTLKGLRDRALIGVMVYNFARVSAVISMKVKDYYTQGRRGWVRLHEKGGKEHDVPCHHALEQYLDEYIAAAGTAGEPDGFLFRTTGRKTGVAGPMCRQSGWQGRASRECDPERFADRRHKVNSAHEAIGRAPGRRFI